MEILVHHLGTEVFKVSKWVVISADVPETLVEKPARVPESWRGPSPVLGAQALGAAWEREKKHAVLRVPSAVVLGEFNYLLNPAHPDFAKIVVGKREPFWFDARFNA